MMQENRRLNDPSYTRKILNYVIARQNEDGGYTFCQGAESNAQDTYYGLSILQMLNASFPSVEKTIKFLRGLDFDSAYSTYYIIKALLLCSEKTDRNLRKNDASIVNLPRYLDPRNVFSEVASELTTTFMTLELADLSGRKIDTSKAAECLLKFKNSDGGFGLNKNSNINSTYYAVASLNLLTRNIRDLHETIQFVRECEKASGGFTVTPISATPYMEHTYYGLMTLDLLGEKCRYSSQTIDFITKCQNNNGGFARSDLGISTFEYTFQAVSVVKTIERQEIAKLFS
jgi:hypothetical protein